MRAAAGRAVLVAFLLTSIAAPVSAAGAPTVMQYARRVHQVRGEVDMLAAHTPVSAGALKSAQDRLRALGEVRLPDRTLLYPDTPGLAAQLSGTDGAANGRVARELDALDDALGGPHLSVSPRVLHDLDTVLRDGRFHPSCQFVECATNWLGDRMKPILDWLSSHLNFSLGGSLGVNPLLKLVFAALILLLVVAIAVLAARGSLRRLVVDVPPPELAEEGLSESAARRRADTLVAEGDYRSALRYLFLATMLELQGRGVLSLQQGRTNQEYVEAIRAGAAANRGIEEPLRQLVQAFDRAWYGHLPFGREQYLVCRQLSTDVLTTLDISRNVA